MNRRKSSPKNSVDQTAANLTTFIISSLGVTVFFILVLTLIYFSQKQNLSLLKDHFVVSTIISLIALFYSLRVSYDLINAKVMAELKSLEIYLTEESENLQGKLNDLQREYDLLKNHSDELESKRDDNLWWKQYEYCLSRMYKIDQAITRRMEKMTVSRLLRSGESIEAAETYLEKKSEEIENKSKLSEVINKFDKKAWNSLATCAVSHALKNIHDANISLDDLPNYYMFIDFRLYLEAWLVSRVESLVYPRIEDIGATYPSSDEPQVHPYKEAFLFLKKSFGSEKILKCCIPETTLCNLTESDIETCKLLVPYVEELEASVISFIQNKTGSKV